MRIDLKYNWNITTDSVQFILSKTVKGKKRNGEEYSRETNTTYHMQLHGALVEYARRRQLESDAEGLAAVKALLVEIKDEIRKIRDELAP